MSGCIDCLIDCFCCLYCSKWDFIEPRSIEWETLCDEYPDYIPMYLEMTENPLYLDMSRRTPKYVNMAP